jgi:formate dehydrogenase major subunit
VIEGSNMAECHPVGFQWVMEAKARGATIIHVDPRFTRTSAMADVHIPIRVGTDIAFLGGLIRHVIENERFFRDYVVNYTNASFIVSKDFKDTEDLDGLFGGWDPEKGQYDASSWQYEGEEVAPAAGQREQWSEPHPDRGFVPPAGHGQGMEGGSRQGTRVGRTDPTLKDPRCVFQILRRDY